MNPTLHILSNPYGITHTKYRIEPFNVAVLKFIANMKDRGFNLLHYGHESAEVDCENVAVITNEDHPPPEKDQIFSEKGDLGAKFTERADKEISRRKRPGDMILCFYGIAHKELALRHQDLFIVEPSIGYWPDTVFAPYRAFTSYSQMHYYYGLHQRLLTPSWFDTVIANAFTPSEFEFNDKKDDYFVFLGRVNTDKGVDLCIQVTEHLGKKLIVAGPGNLQSLGYATTPSHVTHIGPVNMEERKQLLSKAACLMAPTHYLEPFGNIVVEAAMSGTPVLTPDWGGFVDSVVHGVTGFRCGDFKTFVESAAVVDQLDPANCRTWAMDNFSDDVIHAKFENWFKKISRQNFYYV